MAETQQPDAQAAMETAPMPRAVVEDAAVFFGEYEHSIDDKNRLTLNSTLRLCVPENEQDQGFVLALGRDRCLALYTVPTFRRLANRMDETKFSDHDHRARVRDVFRRMVFVKCDAQGRIVLPNHLKQAANLQKDCVEIGVRDHIEIWAKDLYDAYWKMNVGAAEKGGEEMPF